jgi:hypothetical protein
MTQSKASNRHWIHVLAVALALGASFFAPSPHADVAEAAGASYYVDSAAGSDSNSGTSASTPWKNLSAVNNRGFSAGDTIFFKKGSSWTGNLAIKSSGASGNPLTLKAYGTGNAPVVSYPNVKYGHAIDIYGSWVVVQDFLARDGNEAGIFIQPGANNVVVQNNEITKSGEGVNISGESARVLNNYIHDLVLIVNTQGGDDDYGANGIFVNKSSGAEVAYNRIINCRASSYDYKADGGVVEIWGNVSNLNVHHNYSSGSNGYVEVGGGSANNVTIAYNVSDRDYQGFVTFHMSGTFASSLSNFEMDNNTIIKTDNSYSVVDSGGATMPSSVYFRNNIVYSVAQIANGGGFTHSNNLFYSPNGSARLGAIGMGDGDAQADPKFVNYGGGDYHLQSGSPAINTGASLVYTIDFDGNSATAGGAPDKGAYKYGSGGPPSMPSLPLIVDPSAPHLVLGFQVLAGLLGDRTGQPIENEWHNPDNGDGLQQTTTGLMVWRKSDNWTAFTDSSMTWVNGPYGLQMRGNDERFSWEK